MKLRSFRVKMIFFFLFCKTAILNAVTFEAKIKLEMHKLHCKPKIQLQKTLQIFMYHKGYNSVFYIIFIFLF